MLPETWNNEELTKKILDLEKRVDKLEKASKDSKENKESKEARHLKKR